MGTANKQNRLIGILVVALILFFALYSLSKSSGKSQPFRFPNLKEGRRAVLFYAYYEGGYLYKRNMEYFMKLGIRENDGVDYIIVVNGEVCGPCQSLPDYPNIKVVYRENTGYDFGAWGHGLRTTNLTEYNYIVLANPGSRGPFFYPGTLKSSSHWLDKFIDKLTGPVHMVGPTMGCAHNPHVQSYFLVFTKEALAVAFENNVFPTSHSRNFLQVIEQSELGFSKSLLKKGLGVTSMITKYEDHDFRDGSPVYCNHNVDPTWKIFFYLNIAFLDPFDVVFWKMRLKHKSKECSDPNVPCELEPFIDKLTEVLEKEFDDIVAGKT